MTNAVDLQAFAAQIAGKLTGPGGPFEMTVEQVLGAPQPVFKHRHGSLLELLEASRELGDLDYLVSARTRYTFAEHYAAAGALAAALAERYGVGKGDRVGILAANAAEWVLTFWAAQRLGAIPVGYNAWWAPREIAYGLEHSAPKVLIADAKRAALAAETGTDIPVLTMETDVPALLAEFAGGNPSAELSEDDPAIILYTSGTTGRPKGVVHTQRNLVAVADYHRFMDALAAGFRGQVWDGSPAARRYLATMPLFHIASLHNLSIPRLTTGDAVVFPTSGEFDAESLLKLVETERVTNWAAVPTLASRILGVDISKYDLSSLTAFSLNSAPASPALVQRLRERFPVALQGLTTSYGCTESGTAATVATPPELAADNETVGRAVVGVSIEVRDPDGKVVPDGEEGEICVRSPYVMLGYWNNEDATAAAIDEHRWLRTGDFGTLRAGKLYISGRRSDLILRGGENVYPQEIENVLDEHPAVRESAVIGVPHEDLGQEVAAIVVVDQPDSTTADELRDHVARQLAYFKVPARWLITAEPLPRNATGKVLRRDLSLGE
ncbi:class I adenylate-forming enzyme family protein [Nocardia seriolae]|uniref:4-coumarate--CoA ligase n=1 Tax=Nocardia seriolae TaxID=37332 RepID=A0ABC8APU0_9NOCA|nr:class I adenylate-forming enzyme family protein [Nocardia seriolae]APA96218.1 putative 4-coumarate--CoA ligase [Nocardia seriolae]OJF82446.1 fatty acid--CoA ligase [Nocardia seriolae]PSK30820.1 fatty acid--CoA ligase [Nocardia seriolae]QOW33199.1 acyl--CoA ligase [Nocardia seriolae]QUN21053.1 acyl--CoA ligase [Nocardia seriolae]